MARWLKGTVYPYSLWATSAKDSQDHQTLAKTDHFFAHFRPIFANSDPILNPLWWVDRWVDRWLMARWLKGTVYPYSLWATPAKDSRTCQNLAKTDHFFAPFSSYFRQFWSYFEPSLMGRSLDRSVADGSLVKRGGVPLQSLGNLGQGFSDLSKPCENWSLFRPFSSHFRPIPDQFMVLDLISILPLDRTSRLN